jgi:hypothetical protein
VFGGGRQAFTSSRGGGSACKQASSVGVDALGTNAAGTQFRLPSAARRCWAMAVTFEACEELRTAFTREFQSHPHRIASASRLAGWMRAGTRPALVAEAEASHSAIASAPWQHVRLLDGKRSQLEASEQVAAFVCVIPLCAGDSFGGSWRAAWMRGNEASCLWVRTAYGTHVGTRKSSL